MKYSVGSARGSHTCTCCEDGDHVHKMYVGYAFVFQWSKPSNNYSHLQQ